MSIVLHTLALIVIPLLWGLGVEWLFERRRRRREGRGQPPDQAPASSHDWII